MDKNELENYLKQLKEIEQTISNQEDNVDFGFINEIEDLLKKISPEDINPQSINVPSTNEPVADFFKSSNSGIISKSVMVKVKKLTPAAIIPSYSKIGDAGMDLTITSEIENTSFSVSYGFGIAMEIPEGHVGLIFPRSSVRNQELILSNCVGVIDSGYRGELQATFKKTNGLDSIKYKVGERGAQIIILPYPTVYMTEVPELSNTERGTNGFGSTGV